MKPAAESFVAPGSQEVFVRWNCTDVSRTLSRYAIDFSADGVSDWATVNAAPFPADVMCSFTHVAPAGGAYYRVAATDYWAHSSPPSSPVAAVPWPSYADKRL